MKFSNISNQIKKGLQIIIVLATLIMNFGMGGTNKAYAAACDVVFTLTINIRGGGTVTPNPAPDCNGGTQYSAGTVVQLTASPNAPKYAFGGWWMVVTTFEQLVEPTTSFSITMNSNNSVKAKFPPANDDFVTSTPAILPLPFTDTVDTTGAADVGDGPTIPNTVVCDPEKPGQLKLKKGIRNVWYSYTADATKLITIDTLGSTPPPPPPTISNYDTYIAIWTGSDINNLTFVACDDDTGGTLQSSVKLSVTNGFTYYIEAAQWNGYSGGLNETPSGGTLKLNVRDFVQTFADVTFENPYFIYIEALYAAGLTGGCSTTPLNFCPNTSMSRAQSAVFMMRGNYGSGYTPPSIQHVFADSWVNSSWGESWAEGMYKVGLTAGCSPSPLRFCPDDSLTNAQLAVFGLRLKYGNAYAPPAGTGTVFADLTNTSFWGTSWAEKAYADGLMFACGTDAGSGKPKFCPDTFVNRALGAYVIAKAKNLTP